MLKCVGLSLFVCFLGENFLPSFGILFPFLSSSSCITQWHCMHTQQSLSNAGMILLFEHFKIEVELSHPNLEPSCGLCYAHTSTGIESANSITSNELKRGDIFLVLCRGNLEISPHPLRSNEWCW